MAEINVKIKYRIFTSSEEFEKWQDSIEIENIISISPMGYGIKLIGNQVLNADDNLCKNDFEADTDIGVFVLYREKEHFSDERE